MKKENENNLNITKTNYVSLLEIIFFIYCAVLLRNTIPAEFFKVVNFSVNVDIVNRYILSEIAQNNVYYKLKNIENLNKKSYSLDSNKKYDVEEKILGFNSLSIENFNLTYERIKKIDIVCFYIIDMLFLIIYCIYSKSRKRICYCSIDEIN